MSNGSNVVAKGSKGSKGSTDTGAAATGAAATVPATVPATVSSEPVRGAHEFRNPRRGSLGDQIKALTNGATVTEAQVLSLSVSGWGVRCDQKTVTRPDGTTVTNPLYEAENADTQVTDPTTGHRVAFRSTSRAGILRVQANEYGNAITISAGKWSGVTQAYTPKPKRGA